MLTGTTKKAAGRKQRLSIYSGKHYIRWGIAMTTVSGSDQILQADHLLNSSETN